MAKARAIIKRRKAVRNIKKITKTMQMIATAKFQKSLKRAVGTKPYTMKVRELVREVAASVEDFDHPLLRRPTGESRTNKIAVVVITSNRGLAGAYNGNVLRASMVFMREQEKAGKQIELSVIGKKGISYFNYQKRPMISRAEAKDVPSYDDVEHALNPLIGKFTSGEIDAIYVSYMNFISAGQQKADVLELLPLTSVKDLTDLVGMQAAEKESQVEAGALNRTHTGPAVVSEELIEKVIYEFTPSAKELLDELLPLTIKTAFFQTFLDATTSEHVARMISMKAATDNADKMAKALTMQYNRARQSQITTELSEIMGGVEAMKG